MRRTALWTLVVLYAAAFVATFNENIINVVLIDIMGAFGISEVVANWLVTGYMIVTAIVVALMAFLYARFSVRSLLVAGGAFLAVGSVGAFAAPWFPLLLICRLLQAVGTGIFVPLMMTTVLAEAPKVRLGTFLSIGSCCITLGPALAPVVSGGMATLLGWRAVFVLPAISVIIVSVAGAVLARSEPPQHRFRADVPSVVLASLALVLIVYGFTDLLQQTLAACCCLVAGVAATAIFVRRQARIHDPLINIAPFRSGAFSVACVLCMVAMMTTFSMSVVLMLYYEGAVGVSAFSAGALLLVPVLLNAVAALIGGRIMDACGPWPLLPVGFAIMAIGQVLVATEAAGSALWQVMWASAVTYAGVGLVFSPVQTAGLSQLSGKLHPSGVSIMNLCIQVAACIGPALFVGVLSSVAAAAGGAGAAADIAQAQGFSAAVWVGAAVALAGLVASVPFARRTARRS